MKTAVSRQKGGFAQEVETGSGHKFVLDEPKEDGGEDSGPSPTELLAASLASCTAITMQMYAKRKDWDLAGLEVQAGFEQGEHGKGNRFEVVLRLPASLSDEQVGKLVTIAGKCPVHRALADAEATVKDRVERS